MARNYKFYDEGTLENCELCLYKKVNKTLIENFNKVAKWIEENCPTLNGRFDCYHNPYHWTALVVEDGKAYLEYGSHGYGFELALSTTETAIFSRGSEQRIAHARKIQYARNDRLEEFLAQWQSIKMRVVCMYETKKKIYSNEFVA